MKKKIKKEKGKENIYERFIYQIYHKSSEIWNSDPSSTVCFQFMYFSWKSWENNLEEVRAGALYSYSYSRDHRAAEQQSLSVFYIFINGTGEGIISKFADDPKMEWCCWHSWKLECHPERHGQAQQVDPCESHAV